MIEIDPRRFPEEPGVYLFKGSGGDVLYVGKAGNLRARLSHYRPGEVEVRKEGLLARAVDVEIMLTRSEKEALLLESTLIKRHRPRYNVRLTDDKRYPYIKLSGETYPRVSIVRDTRGRGHFFGPFPDAGAAKQTLQVIREVFKIRDCKQLIPGGCLNYQMNLCWAPCILDRDERLRKAPNEAIARVDVDATYAKASEDARAFLRGDSGRLARQITQDMEAASESMAFERAAKLRDRLNAITRTLERQAVFARGKEDRDAFVVEREGPLAVGVVTFIRDGQVAGQEHFFFRRDAHGDESELLAQFVRRYYEHMPTVPSEVHVGAEIPEAEALSKFLSEQHDDRPVRILVPQRGDMVQVVAMARRNARFKLSQERLRRGEREGGEETRELQQALKLPKPPARIECFDISHLYGTGVVASMSVLVDGTPERSEYRRFKMHTDRNDDFAAIEEAVSRRYARLVKENGPLPDLVLIDGGRGQLAAAKRALDDLGLAGLPLASLAKQEEEVYLPHLVRPLRLPQSGPGAKALLTLMRARDEAHRFALDYQRRTRAAAFTKSALDDVPGIGERKKRALLAAFGSLDAVVKASESELARVPGVGKDLARKIRERLDART